MSYFQIYFIRINIEFRIDCMQQRVQSRNHTEKCNILNALFGHIALTATTACVDVTETGKILLSYFILNN